MQTTSVVIVVLWRIAMFWNAEANVMPNITMPETEQLYTVNDGDNITCTATGYPVPDIVWLNNGGVVNANRLKTDSVTTANISNLSSVSVSMLVTRNDAGVYMCVANNSVGNDTHTITIAVQLAPVITSPDAKQAYNITDGDSITCTATGFPVPDIVWLNNDEDVVEENSASVMTTDIDNIPSVSVSMIIRRSDGGIYTCLANNSVGNDTSTVHITVQHKDCCGEPDIILEADCTTNKFVQLKWISRLTSRFHFCIRYHCNADDSVEYCSATQYCYDGFNRPYFHDRTTHTYLGEVPVVVPDNASCCFWVENVQYRREPSRGCSKLFCCKNELLNITMPEAEQEYNITEGDNITCTAIGYPVPDIVWLNNDGSVVNASRLIADNVMTADINNLSSVSVSMIVTRSDSGVYTCLANNSLGNDTRMINITVESLPIVIVPEIYIVREDSSVVCTATGYPVPDIIWLNNDESVVDENRIKTDSVMVTGVNNLYNVSVSMTVGRNDAGVYICIANNSIGNDTRTINITVHSFPVITTPETKQMYNITDGDSITCTATGYPVPSIVWLNNDGSIYDENRLIPASVTTTDIGNIPSVSVSMIIRRSDGGIYTCLANNSVGNDTSTVHITVQYKDCCGEPDIQLTANCTTNKYVQLKWTSRPSRFGFCVRYYCNADDSVDYCLATEQCNRYGDATETYMDKVPVVVSDNASCCFWVENVQFRNHRSGCSKLVCCYIISQYNTTIPSNTIFDYSTTATTSFSTLSTNMMASTVTPTTLSVPTTLSLSISKAPSPSVSQSSKLTVSTLPPPVTPSETMTSIAPSPSVSHVESPKLTDSSRLTIIFCVIFIFMVLLSTFLICLFSLWWKKSKRKNTELEITVKTQIEKYFDDTDDLPKDCISEVEVVIDNKDHSDGISITEDEIDILAMISNKRPTSLSSSIVNIINDEEHDGIADISESAITHYCTGGSAGSQSNTSSQRASCTSATPLSTDT